MKHSNHVIILGFLLLILTGCTTKPLEANNKEELIPVQVEKPKISTFKQYIELTGRTTSYADYPVVIPSPLKVEEVYVQLGDQVKEGEPLLQFNNDDAMNNLKELQKTIATLETKISEAKTTFHTMMDAQQQIQKKLAQSLSHTEQVVKNAQNGQATMNELIKASTDLMAKHIQAQSIPTLDPLKLEQLEMQLKQAKQNYLTLQRELEKLEVKAPFSGEITLKTVEPKGLAIPNKPLLQVSDMSKMIVELQVGRNHIDSLEKGQKAFVHLEGTKEEIPSKLHYISQGMGPEQATYQAQIVLDNDQQKFHPGQIATVKVEINSLNQALLIPVQAVFFEGDQAFVYVIENQLAYKKRIDVGPRNQLHYVVKEGIDPAASIVVKGRDKLSNGKKVHIISKEK